MGTFFTFDVMESGSTEDREKEIAEQLYNSFSSRDLKFDMEHEQTKAPANKDEDY
jgi:hypothetical protein